MRVSKNLPKSTEAQLTVVADASELNKIKAHVFKHFSKDLKVPGFRPGKLPLDLVEKHADPSLLHSEFLEHAINDLYPAATKQADIRPTGQPQIDIKKFVPFTTLEFQATVPVIGKIKLADYKKIRKDLPKVKIAAKDVDEVLNALRHRSATKEAAHRPAKNGDEVVIDFAGIDEKKQPVKGADGKDYPLILGSKSFIPGFEENLIGMKADEQKTFTLTFPKDYGVKALANRKVTFDVNLKTVNELKLPELDDEFAKSVGPVQSVDQLKADITKELQFERQNQANLAFESELVQELAKKSTIELPETLINEEVDRLLNDLKQNLLYRGQTILEFLENEGVTEDEYKNKELKKRADERVKAGIMLAEIADIENIQITPEEFEARIQALKAQYQDEKMREQLDKPENRREILSRMLSEKTVAFLAQFAQ